MAEYRHFANPDPEWINFPHNLPPGTKVSPGMKRDRLPIEPEAGLLISELDVKVRDSTSIRVRRYMSSEHENAHLPLFIYMHGGGFVTGGLETDDRYCRLIARQLEVQVLSVEYRLAPEHKFPVGWEDSRDVVHWAASPAGRETLSIDLTKGFLLGGTSAGANFTAGLAHIFRDAQDDKRLDFPLTGLVFLAGSFCHPDARPKKYLDRILSVDEINDAPGLTRKSIDYFAGKYGAPPEDKRLSPLLFESHADVAKKVFFGICGWDPRRDEAILLELLLKQEDIETKSIIYPGLPHGFWTTCPDLPVSKTFEDDLVNAIRWLLL